VQRLDYKSDDTLATSVAIGPLIKAEAQAIRGEEVHIGEEEGTIWCHHQIHAEYECLEPASHPWVLAILLKVLFHYGIA
jgi:hypothetical protein